MRRVTPKWIEPFQMKHLQNKPIFYFHKQSGRGNKRKKSKFVETMNVKLVVGDKF
jgi:hypothetical protein